MFGNNRIEIRRVFTEAWRKHRANVGIATGSIDLLDHRAAPGVSAADEAGHGVGSIFFRRRRPTPSCTWVMIMIESGSREWNGMETDRNGPRVEQKLKPRKPLDLFLMLTISFLR